MKRKGLLPGSIVVTVIVISVLLINRFLIAIPDWAIRIAGVILLVDLVVFGFLVARSVSGKKVGAVSNDL